MMKNKTNSTLHGTMKTKKHFSLLRLLMVIALKDIERAEMARQYILGDTSVAKDYNEFQKWQYRNFCAENGIKIVSPPTSQAKQSEQ